MSTWPLLIFRSVGQRSLSKVKPFLYMLGKGGISVLQTAIFSDLTPLGLLPYLLILDVSHNKVSKLLDFTPPKNLKEVDLSYNEIEEMSDLSAHHYLTKLCLDRILQQSYIYNYIVYLIELRETCENLCALQLTDWKDERLNTPTSQENTWTPVPNLIEIYM